MAATNQSGLATPPTTPPAPSKAQILEKVISLATQFSTCVEAFNLIHPSKVSDHTQKVALAALGVQQGRLLIFGDGVGISSPPANIARHMIPSHPGATNPDPTLPVHFGVRDSRLDEAGTTEKVRAALDEIAGRPSTLSRDELMEKYGLKSPKRFSAIGYPALDTNRLEAFREKYGLLQDLARQTGAKGPSPGLRRGMSMTVQHWTVRDVDRFNEFIKTVRIEVDGLIALMGVKEQVDRGMKTDIRAMGWHPDLSGPLVRQDWEKLRLIREACAVDYPEYIGVTDTALQYISEELKGTHLAILQAAYQPSPPTRRKSEADTNGKASNGVNVHEKGKEKRPNLFSLFKSLGKSSSKVMRERAKGASPGEDQDPQRSMSEDIHQQRPDDDMSLEPVRSKSLSAVPDAPAPFNLDSRLKSVPAEDEKPATEVESSEAGIPIRTSSDLNQLTHADTAQSLIDRHDMFKGPGRVETKDIRAKAHDWAI